MYIYVSGWKAKKWHKNNIKKKKKPRKKKKVSEISAARRITDEYLKRLEFEAFKSN